MQSTPISSIQIIDRQRKEIGQTDLQKLKISILSKGLLHAPVLITNTDGSLRLLAGERRLRAIASLHEEGHIPLYDGTPIPTDHIPYVLVSELNPYDRAEAELEENLLRKNLTWMEQAEAVDALQKLREHANPKQTKLETAKELADLRSTSVNHERRNITQSQLIVAHKDNPEVLRSKTAEEAYKKILDAGEKKFRAALELTKEIEPDAAHQIHHGDCREILPGLPAGCCNTIIADPPYGIDADKSGQESKHHYRDDPAYGREIAEFIIKEGFRLLPPRGILLCFCDIDHFVHLRQYALRQAYSVYRTPLIWYKDVGGRTPWGRAGFKRSYELILFAVKGEDELLEPGGNDVLTFRQSPRNERDHAANKPQALLERLISLTTAKGETILDPTCGSGTIIPAANAIGVKTICVELDELSYSKAIIRGSSGSKTDDTEADAEDEDFT